MFNNLVVGIVNKTLSSPTTDGSVLFRNQFIINMTEKNKYQRLVAQVLGTRLISFNPDLAKALGSIKASLFLNQLLYWWKKGRDPEWIYKTIDEMKEETTLSRDEQDLCIKICKKFGLIELGHTKGIPPKRNFQLNIEKIAEFLQKSNSVIDDGSEKGEV